MIEAQREFIYLNKKNPSFFSTEKIKEFTDISLDRITSSEILEKPYINPKRLVEFQPETLSNKYYLGCAIVFTVSVILIERFV